MLLAYRANLARNLADSVLLSRTVLYSLSPATWSPSISRETLATRHGSLSEPYFRKTIGRFAHYFPFQNLPTREQRHD